MMASGTYLLKLVKPVGGTNFRELSQKTP